MVICCEIASGDKVVDNQSNSFFKQVLMVWPKVDAVEMKGAGLANAIEQFQVLGISTGFMMIRGISDLPRDNGKKRGTKERDAWKLYASDVAAAFIVGWISDGLPVRPSDRSTQR
jgi:nucleoside phosphorylase